MMIRRWNAVLLLFAAPLAAQGNPECAGVGGGQLPPIAQREQNVCNAAIDGAHLFTPVAGILLSGGNPFLGSAGGLGGFPHTGLTVRANVTKLVIPDLDYSGDGTTVGARRSVPAPAPLIEAALGVFGGLANGSLAVDALGSAQLIPTSLISDVHVNVNARRIGSVAVGLGVGARVTLIDESTYLPAVAVSIMHRSIPTIGVGSVAEGDEFAFESNMSATNYRVTIGKRIGFLALGAGAGWDKYSGDAAVDYRDPVTLDEQEPIPVTLADSRALGFVDAGFAVGQFYLIGEAGMQAGKDLHLGTTFTGNNPNSNRLFGSLGLRLGL
ncbi:MAG TPA: hypothetical protein VHW65_00665 [Gemmatimonadales bacterium]|jgi:hypothetical protein|nr:hypothetical protein [Gemmatimonadales bacterium]